MATVKDHYRDVLSPVYSWMLGGFDAAIERNVRFFAEHAVTGPVRGGVAVDLGAGSGFQSIPLARLGYRVVAIDLDRGLLEELRANADDLPITCVEGDLLEFGDHVTDEIELAVCMTDTLLHLESRRHASDLIRRIAAALGPGGRFILSFRDLTHELEGLDRFLPVCSDDDRIMTCFLEYEPDSVRVHDLVYERTPKGWDLRKSFYRKLRLSRQWVADELGRAGFDVQESVSPGGMLVMIATRR